MSIMMAVYLGYIKTNSIKCSRIKKSIVTTIQPSTRSTPAYLRESLFTTSAASATAVLSKHLMM